MFGRIMKFKFPGILPVKFRPSAACTIPVDIEVIPYNMYLLFSQYALATFHKSQQISAVRGIVTLCKNFTGFDIKCAIKACVPCRTYSYFVSSCMPGFGYYGLHDSFCCLHSRFSSIQTLQSLGGFIQGYNVVDLFFEF